MTARGASSRRPDRVGQRWQDKGPYTHGVLTITGWRDTPEAEYYDGLWEFESVNVFGEPFTGTIGEDVLKREHVRERGTTSP